MIIPGLCSVTFRPMKPLDICKLSQQAGLKSIEWGGDVHVTNEQEAREVAKMSADYGLDPASYGSYYRAGMGKQDEFVKTLDCALALGARNVRVWAGTKGSNEMTGMERAAVVRELRECGELAMAAGITLSLSSPVFFSPVNYFSSSKYDAASSSVICQPSLAAIALISSAEPAFFALAIISFSVILIFPLFSFIPS